MQKYIRIRFAIDPLTSTPFTLLEYVEIETAKKSKFYFCPPGEGVVNRFQKRSFFSKKNYFENFLLMNLSFMTIN